MRREIKFGGFGGQGIVLAGYITGKAVALYDGKHSVFTQLYGPEARGGASSSEVVIDEDKVIDYPYVTSADVMVIMSQEAYDKYVERVKEGGILIVDEDLVKVDDRAKRAVLYKVPATRMAEKLGNKIVANIVMLGFLTAVTGLVSREAMVKSIRDSVPERFLEINMRAFEEGYSYAQEVMGGA